MDGMTLGVLVAGFPVQMIVVIMVIVVIVILSTHTKVMHQILQFWRNSVVSALSPSLVPSPQA